jgi:RNA polymerase sigma-70 factor (ECF subfamily)
MPDSTRYNEFIELLRIHTNRILGYLDALLLNRADAEDLFQETCIVLWQKFDEFKTGTNFLAWALRIADRKVMNFQTTRSRHAAFTAGLRDVLITEITDRNLEKSDDNLATLANCMLQLPQADRHLVTICYAEDQPIPHVADAMGRSPESVYHSLRRIRNRLLECIRRHTNQTELPASIQRRIVNEGDAR